MVDFIGSIRHLLNGRISAIKSFNVRDWPLISDKLSLNLSFTHRNQLNLPTCTHALFTAKVLCYQNVKRVAYCLRLFR